METNTGEWSLVFPSTSFNFVRPTHRKSRNQYCFPTSVAALGGPNWNVWGSLLNDLCRQGSQSDCKHMERFLRQEKHLYNAERKTDRGTAEKGKQQKEMKNGCNPSQQSDNWCHLKDWPACMLLVAQWAPAFLLLPSLLRSPRSNKLLTFCLVVTARIMGLVSSGMSNK